MAILTLYKKQRNKCNNLVKKAKASYYRNLIEENAMNPKKFWNCVKSCVFFEVVSHTNLL